MSDIYFDERMETLPPDALLKVQDHRLRWQFRRCWDGSPFYRARFEAAGLSPETFGGLADLARLPHLTKTELEVNGLFEDVGLDAWQVAPSDWIEQRRSAGSHLRRWTHGDSQAWNDRQARVTWAAGANQHDAIRRKDAGCDLPAMLRSPLRRSLPPVLVEERTQPILEIGPSTFAFQCVNRDGYHWIGDHFLAELLHKGTGEPVAYGAPGLLTVTELTREASPVLRLVTEHIFVGSDEPCPCGRTGLRLWSQSAYRKRRRR